MLLNIYVDPFTGWVRSKNEDWGDISFVNKELGVGFYFEVLIMISLQFIFLFLFGN